VPWRAAVGAAGSEAMAWARRRARDILADGAACAERDRRRSSHPGACASCMNHTPGEDMSSTRPMSTSGQENTS
jgi:hypothetical protein